MNTFNLISPSQSTIRFEKMVFPDSQPHIKIDMGSIADLNRNEPLKLLSRISNASDLLLVLFVKNTLDYLEFEKVELCISYLIAARMDRVMMDGEPFSLKVITGILNQGRFKKINVFDTHSEVTTALLERSYQVTNHQFVKDAMADYFNKIEKDSFCLVSPDAGALKKIHKLAQFLGVEDVVECTKERDLKTGALTNFRTMSDDLDNKTCFIIDDICDGGGTFAGTAKMLKEKGAKKVVLIVSHGIFSKGPVIEYVDEIYTTNSYKMVEKINCFPVEKYL
ncbi:MAG: ribose-phosphate diphosphokinase [Chitinophagaceae bacterium]